MIWRPFNDDCLHCGGDAEVLTVSDTDNLVYDGEKARCTDCGCPGVIVLQDDGLDDIAAISWHDEPGCE